MVTNKNLYRARNTKNDEFYTTLECIEKELSHYKKHFFNKVVLCNCDDPYESNFCKYFADNFLEIGLKKLICTSYFSSKVSEKNNKKGTVLILEKDSFNCDGERKPIKSCTKTLEGDGDFRSDECLSFLDECDIVVTNPPFSLFKEFFGEIMKRHKNFLIIGNQNALTYKEIFPYIQKNLVWTGYQFGEMKFRVPDDSEPRATRFWIDENGQKWRSLGNAMWLTNLDIPKRHKALDLTKTYKPELYPKYDLFDAINVRTINDIPYDYDGIMGVPITIINRLNGKQFEIIGEANHGSDNEFDLFKPTINGAQVFKRILIKAKRK